jgi:hypothetical protein
VLAFIFTSAYFFPDASTQEVLLYHPPLNHEAPTEERSATSLRPASEAPLVPTQGERLERDQLEVLTAVPMQQLDAEVSDAVLDAERELDAENEQTSGPQQEVPAVSVETAGTSEDATATKQPAETDASPKMQDEVKEIGAKESAAQKLPSHIAGMLARVKATQEAVEQEKKEVVSGESTLDGTSTGHGHSLRSRSEDEGQETSQPGGSWLLVLSVECLILIPAVSVVE